MKPRYYIQRSVHCPESDLWVEMEQIDSEQPKFHVYGNYKGHPEKILTMSVPTANRLAVVVRNFNNRILDVKPDWKAGTGQKETEQPSDTERFAVFFAG